MAEVLHKDSSKSKRKRLNQKAKHARVESSLKSEKDKRILAEKASQHWKEKALHYKRCL